MPQELHEAAAKGDAEAVVRLIAAGEPVNGLDAVSWPSPTRWLLVVVSIGADQQPTGNRAGGHDAADASRAARASGCCGGPGGAWGGRGAVEGGGRGIGLVAGGGASGRGGVWDAAAGEVRVPLRCCCFFLFFLFLLDDDGGSRRPSSAAASEPPHMHAHAAPFSLSLSLSLAHSLTHSLSLSELRRAPRPDC